MQAAQLDTSKVAARCVRIPAMQKLILASNSPRRKALFSLFGWPFIVLPADIDEQQQIGESPEDLVRRLACEKAAAVAAAHAGLVIAADTIVVDDSQLLGKPQDAAEAGRMLRRLRGHAHRVYTGIAIGHSDTGQHYEDVCCTDVPMRNYSDEEISAYIATGDPLDKAGAYAIQHAGFHPVEGINGCFASVMGLPICHLVVGLRQVKLLPPENMAERCQDLLNYACPIFEQVLGKG